MLDKKRLTAVDEHSVAMSAGRSLVSHVVILAAALALGGACVTAAPAKALALEGETPQAVVEEEAQNELENVAASQAAATNTPVATNGENSTNNEGVVNTDGSGDQQNQPAVDPVTSTDQQGSTDGNAPTTEPATTTEGETVTPDQAGTDNPSTPAEGTSEETTVSEGETTDDAVVPAEGETTGGETSDDITTSTDPATVSDEQGTSDADDTTVESASANQEEAGVEAPQKGNIKPQKAGSETPRKGHKVTRDGKDYFVWDDDNTDAKSTLIGPDNGAAFWMWVMADGSILKGKWDNGAGRVYVADSSGKLIGSDLTKNSWVVTSKYDGSTKRYWIDIDTRAAITGFFTAEGSDYYGLSDAGYVLQGTQKWGDYVILANTATGKLPSTEGWVTSSAYGQKTQLYWMQKIYEDFLGTKPGFSSAGYVHYTTPAGYVLRGAKKWGDYVILANTKTGKLPTTLGWVTSSAYGHTTQLYRTRKIYNNFLGTKPGFSSAGYAHYTTEAGYVLRGAKKWGDYVIVAGRKTGRLPVKTGWVVTDTYGQGKQRYWLQKISGNYLGTKPGFSSGGYVHYTLPAGYVLRGTKKWGNYVIIAGKSTGKLPTKAGWLVSDDYGQGSQRYWVQKIYKNFLGTKPGYSTAGWAHYTTASGYVSRNKQVKVNGKTYTATSLGQLLGNSYYDKMLLKIDKGTKSATNWMVVVDKTNHNIAVLHRASKISAWEFVQKARCSIGMGKSSANVTLSGQWTVGGKYYEQTHYGYTDWYHTNVCPLEVTQMEIHSVLYSEYSKTRLVDGRLGMNISNGCVRTTLEMAKYIYDCVPPKSRVWVYD